MLKYLLTSILFFVIVCGLSNSAEAQTYYQIIEAVRLNQQDLKQITVFLQDENNDLHISEEDLTNWHIIAPPNYPPVTYFGKKYYPLYTFTGASYKLDKQTSSVDLTIPIDFMQENAIHAGESQFRNPTKPNFGAFLNYNVLGQATYNHIDQKQIGGFLAPGIFTSHGTLTSNFLAQINSISKNNLNNAASLKSKNQFTRLNTTWQSDFPNSMKTLRLGDAYSVSGMWGRSVNFGGIQWSTNFTTQPTFITFPTLSSKGQSTVPTSVDLLVNNSLVSSSKINAGPFSIDNIPTVDGAGNVNIVTTDALGRQQVINIPYYTSTSLLKKGLHNFSFELGTIRQNYGIDSNNYANLLLTGTDAFGVTNNFTSEVHAEILQKQRTVGLGGNYLLGKFGVLNAAAALSNSKLGNNYKNGGLAKLGFQRQALSKFSFGINTQLTSANFMQAGYDETTQPPSMQNQVFVSMLVKKASLGLSLTQQNNRGSNNVDILNLSYNQNIFANISLNVAAFTNLHGSKNRAVMLTLTKALNDRTTAAFTGNFQENNNNGTLQITRNLPTDTGYGYNVLVTQGQQQNYQGALMGQTSAGTYAARLGYQNSTTGAQLEAGGGIIALGGETFFTRVINNANSFAVVDVSGIPNVTIYNQNNPIAKTNNHGKAVITNLLPYQDNKVEIQPNDLPLNTTITTTKLNLVPYSNSGIVVKFPVKIDHPALLTLINAQDNKPIPMGATVRLLKTKNIATKNTEEYVEYVVASDGEVYIPDMNGSNNTLLVTWDDTKCSVTLNYPKTKDPLPNLGQVICK